MSTYVIRSKHDKENSYSVISNKLIRNGNVSFKSRGILIYLLSFPDDWKIQVKHICNENNVGEDLVYSALKELKEKGFVRFHKIRDEKGAFSNSYYEFSESPIFLENLEELKEKVPQGENPDLDNPDLENPDYTKYSPKRNTEITNSPLNLHIETSKEQEKKREDFLTFEYFIEKNKLDISEKKKLQWRYRFPTGDQEIINALKLAILQEPDSLEAYTETLLQRKVVKNEVIENLESNKVWAKKLEQTFKHPVFKIEALNKNIEIYQSSGMSEPWTLSYTENGFINQVESYLRKQGVYQKNE